LSPRPQSLRLRLTAAFVVVAMVPAALLGGYALVTAPREAGERVAAGDRLVAQAVAGEVDRFLEAQLLHVRELALAIDVDREPRGVARDEHLALHLSANPAIQTLLVLDATGRAEASAPDFAELRGIDFSGQPWWRQAMERRQPTWSSATISLETGQPTVTLVVPVRGRAVVAYLDLDSLRRVVGHGGRGAHDATVSVLDEGGTFIAHPDERPVRERANVRDLPVVAAALRGDERTEEAELLGTRSLVSTARVPLSGWAVLVAHPVDSAFAAQAAVRNAILLALFAALVLALGGGIVVSRELARPIEALVARTGMIAAGEAPAPLPEDGVTETRALSFAFEAMADAVRAREAALARSERAYRELIDAPLVGVVRTRVEDATIEFANRGFARMLGAASPEELVGKSMLSRWEDRARRDAMLDELRRAGRVENVELHWRRHDGAPLVALASFALDGDRLSGVLMDVTSLRQADAERARLEEQLRHAQKLEAVGRLAGGIAHDFNNLLTAITGFATVVRDALPPDHAERESVDVILQSADRAAHLTRSLLAYSRKQVLRPRPMDVREAVEAVARLAGRVLGEDVALEVRLGAARLVVLADQGQLEQVLLNLCTNARDAMPRGGRITIASEEVTIGDSDARTLELARGGRYARLTVTDTGEGMSREVQERIFEPFFTTKPSGQGTGLGLAIVYGIVRQHEGAVQVRSAAGAGTTFTIVLPLAAAAEPRASGPERIATGPRGTETILVAEDEPLVRRVIRAALERAGYGVLEATDGADAVEVFRRNRDRVRLCVLDVVMPGLNGREALQAIQRIDPGARAIYLSGYAADVLTARGVEDGGAALVTKPVAPDDLLRAVREAIDRPAARERAEG
jgi:signal transduction histidine kinase/ActR/RegA family two-component response regulator